MNSEVKVYTRENGEIQRVQVVRWEDWSQLDFLCPKQEGFEHQLRALNCFYEIYKNFLVPTAPWIFPQMVMFCLPEDVELADGKLIFAKKMSDGDSGASFYESEKYGKVSDKLIAASIILEEGVKLRGGKPRFTTLEAEALWNELESRGCIRIVCGKFPSTKIIPVGNCVGYMSKCETNAQMKVNANFFIMDPFDCATIYDQVGTPFGLCLKDGVVINPPLFQREAFMVEQDGLAYVSKKDVSELLVEIDGKTFIPGKNATIFTRPKQKKAPETKGVNLVIVGRRVVAVKQGGRVDIPASGFVMQVHQGCKVAPGAEVTYHGLKDVQFGIQVGNSIIRKGVKTDKFISRFYNIYHLERVPFPPSLYPMDFEKARAARIALGADKEGKPVVFWAEGKGKLSYVAGEDSTGASLSEMADIAVDLGLRNAVNLDGGGSAQILLNNARALHISDRNKEDNSDAERLVPMGLIYK